MKVIKRNGTESIFDFSKIKNAITKASNATQTSTLTNEIIDKITEEISNECLSTPHAIGIEDIQDKVENKLMSIEECDVARNYIKYRYQRMLNRNSSTLDEKIMSLVELSNQEVMEENSNKNPVINSTQRDYIAGEVSRDLSTRKIMPKDVLDAHNEGAIHVHDMDYLIQRMHNCDLINLEDMLQNGTVISGTMIESPKSFSTACNVATQIIAQVASNQYGGQTVTLSHLAPFVDVSRRKIRANVKKEFEGIDISDDKFNKIVEDRVKDEVKKGVQTIQYQVLTLLTTNGQTPFLTVFMYLGEVSDPQTKDDLALIIEETLKQRYQGIKNVKGEWITPAFPKLIYCLEEDNIHEDSKYWYLTKLAAKCTAKRLVPDYLSEKIVKQIKKDKNGDSHVICPMGCRSFLSPYVDENGNKKIYGRFNKGVVSINLPYIAMLSHGDMTEFWALFDKYLELCHEGLKCKVKRLKGTVSDVAPILWQHGALARLEKGETIDKLFYGGYSTTSLGYAGLYECTKYMTGKSHTDPEIGKPFALKVMQYMNDKCAEWNAVEDIGYGIYGTPLETTTYKFAKALQKFEKVKDVNDHNYITNSFHINVREQIDAFSKLKFESEFQYLSASGSISYVEVPNMQNNIPGVLEVIKYIYETTMYAELNSKSDYCQCCGYDGEIKIIEDDGKLLWECPNCGNRDQNKMNVARRTCGYIGTNFWNQGRTQEIKDRVMHL